MLKVYTVKSYLSIDNGDWQHVGVDGYTVTDDNPTEKIIFENFTLEQCYDYLLEKRLDGIWPSKTFFRKKPMIYINDGSLDRKPYYSFNTITYKYVYKEWESVSLEWIIKHLSADQCIQYLKERGITTCPIIK